MCQAEVVYQERSFGFMLLSSKGSLSQVNKWVRSHPYLRVSFSVYWYVRSLSWAVNTNTSACRGEERRLEDERRHGFEEFRFCSLLEAKGFEIALFLFRWCCLTRPLPVPGSSRRSDLGFYSRLGFKVLQWTDKDYGFHWRLLLLKSGGSYYWIKGKLHCIWSIWVITVDKDFNSTDKLNK